MIELREPKADEVRRVVREFGEDLTSVRERNVILRGIVRRTRSLIGTDMAYLSVNDLAAGETHIEYSDGVTTSAYRDIRMPLGTGVLGAVAAGNRPVQTNSYLPDPELNHLPEIDEIVRAEGVRAILGVPIRIGGRVVAALMVAHREEVHFSETVVAALSDLAAQAGVAFEQTRLNRELTTLKAEVTTTRSIRQRRHDELETLLRLDDRLTSALIASTGLQGLVDVIVEASGGPVGVYAPSGELLAGTGLIEGERLCSAELHIKIAASQRSQGAAAVALEGGSLLLMAAAAGDEHIATLVAPESSSTRAVIGRAAVFVATLRLFERSLVEANNRAQTELIDDLIAAGDRDHPALLARLASHGVDGKSGLRLHVCVVPGDPRAAEVVSGVRAGVAETPAIVSVHSGHLCVVTSAHPEPHAPGVGERIHCALLARGFHALVGTAAAAGIGEAGAAHQEAAVVVDALRSLGHADGAADTLGLGLAGMMAGARDARWVDRLIVRVLGPVLEYDDRNRTRLCLTAWHYLENGGRLAATAEQLHVHVNTVRQRADRLDTLLGESWRRAPRSVDVHFALRLWMLRRPAE